MNCNNPSCGAQQLTVFTQNCAAIKALTLAVRYRTPYPLTVCGTVSEAVQPEWLWKAVLRLTG